MSKLLLFTITLSMCLPIMAQHITEEQARQKAQAFMQGKFEAAGGSRRAPRRMQRVAKAAENDAFYIFNAEDNGGFVIVSGDERTEEILGYSTEGNIDLDKMPENMQAWLKGYEEQINSLQPNANRAPSYVPVHPAVEPLITSKWNQGSPYNLQCPMQTPEGYTEPLQCVTGCVATAMAQIMYYHKWPKEMTTAIPAYDYGYVGWDQETQTGIYKYHEDALPPTTFEWDLMKDTYNGNETGAEAQAVAKLMRYCGQSVEMVYGPGSSGAHMMSKSLINYFDYDKGAKLVSRRSGDYYYYNNQEWDELIYGEVSAKRPVWCSGNSLTSGHCFVCDGYDGNGLYHFNWGWGGQSDGYFLLSLSDSEGNVGGFDSFQSVIVGIQLPTSQDKIKPDIWDDHKVEGSLVGIAWNNDLWGIYAYYSNLTDSYLMIDGAIGLLKDDGSVEVLTTLMEKALLEKRYDVTYSDERFFEGFYETFGLEPDAPTLSNLPNGTYKLVALWKEISETQWHYYGEKSGNYIYWVFTVDGDNRTIEVKNHFYREDIKYTATIEPIGSMLSGEQQRLAIHCVNEGIDCSETLYLFVSQTEEKGNPVNSITLNMDKNTEETVFMYFTPKQEGIYHVWICSDYYCSKVIAQTDMTISKPLNISINSSTFDWSTMTMSVTVTNNDEVPYDREVAVRIVPFEDYGKEDAGLVFKSGKLHIESGQSVKVDIDCTGLSIDNLYMAYVMYYRNPNSDVKTSHLFVGLNMTRKDCFMVNGILYVIADTERHYVFAESCNSDVLQQLTVPSTVVSPNDGVTYTVKGISGFFCQYNDVTTLSFSYGITTIAYHAVQGCESLETIVLPGSLNRIEVEMISDCPNLKAIYSKAQEAPLIVSYGVSNSLIGWDEPYDDIILYVPKGSRVSYAKAWSLFSHIVEMDVEAMQPPTKTLIGDMNGDGSLSVTDVTILIDKILKQK